MVKVTALLADGNRFECDYPDAFFDAALAMDVKGKSGAEIVAALMEHEWPALPTIVDVIRDEDLPAARSLRLWC